MNIEDIVETNIKVFECVVTTDNKILSCNNITDKYNSLGVVFFTTSTLFVVVLLFLLKLAIKE